jgi:hypothetical protein
MGYSLRRRDTSVPLIKDGYYRLPRFGEMAHGHDVIWVTMEGRASGRHTRHYHAGGDVEHHSHRAGSTTAIPTVSRAR